MGKLLVGFFWGNHMRQSKGLALQKLRGANFFKFVQQTAGICVVLGQQFDQPDQVSLKH